MLGTYDENRLKQGRGVYVWMREGEEEEKVEVARYEGGYVDGVKSGFGMMRFPSGDVYEGEFQDNKMHGTGTYTYKKSQDIYSGAWVNNLKHGQGRYEYFADKSMLVGTWEAGSMVSGEWELRDSAVFSGSFRLGVPVGAGRFAFKSGLVLTGAFEEQRSGDGESTEEKGEAEEGEAEAAEAVAAEPPVVSWRSDSIVSF